MPLPNRCGSVISLTRRFFMADGLPKELETALWKQFRDFFAKAERKRRWSLDKDIPWGDCNPNLDPAIADVVESFCAVELFLPDYIPKFLSLNRTSRGRAWFLANWGYE